MLLLLVACEKESFSTTVPEADQDLDLRTQTKKIYVCHYSPADSKWQVINISINAWSNREGNGDIRLDDQDGDGWVEAVNECVPGGDCDDNDAEVNPGAKEKPYNGKDDDCNAATPDDGNASNPDDDPDGEENDQPELIFHTHFEGSSAVVPTSNSQIDDIVGIDNTVLAPNDWVEDFDKHPNIGEYRIYYEAGDASERSAKIIPEPGNSLNNVLMFRLDKPNVNSTKGRVQADIYKNNGLKEIYQTVRVFFHPDFNQLKTYPERMWWLNIFEAWNNADWTDQNYPFRVSVHFEKRRSSNPEELYFHVKGQTWDKNDNYQDYWAQTNWDVPLPIGQWITLETYFLEGDYDSGRFYVTMQPDGGQKVVIFDIHNLTHHPDDPAPDGLSEFSPMKLYAPDEIINFMQANNKTLQVYWDDYELWQNKQPDFIGGN